MRKVIDEDKETYIVTFDNLKEFLAQSVDQSIPENILKHNQSELRDVLRDNSSGWRFGTEYSYEEFLKARQSPDKGKKLCADDIKQTMSSKKYQDVLKTALTYRRRNVFVDSGVRLSVPRALQGDDKPFVKISKANKPTVKIAINICVSCCVEDEDIMKIAKCAILTTYALETAGISTEIWFCTFNTGLYETSAFKHALYQTKFKSAEERFSWTTFAPTFTVGAYRHTYFASWCRDEHKIGYGYGMPMKDSVIKQNDNYGYALVIGNNAPGPVTAITEIFAKLKKK